MLPMVMLGLRDLMLKLNTDIITVEMIYSKTPLYAVNWFYKSSADTESAYNEALILMENVGLGS